MKIKIRGEVDLPTLGHAFASALNHVNFNPEEFEIRGATIYINAYDRKTGGVIELKNSNDELVNEVLYLTPIEREKERQRQAAKKKGKAVKLYTSPADHY